MDKKLSKLKGQQEDIFHKLAEAMAALSAPVRLKLLHYLSQAPLSVEVLAEKSGQSVANTSMHLRKLFATKLVAVEVIGQKRLYTLAPSVLPFWEEIQNFAQKIDPSAMLDVKSIYGDLSWPESTERTLDLLSNKEAILLDVRPNDEVTPDSQSLPNYHHIPMGELAARMSELPKRKRILVMCRGRLCALSAFAVNLLREHDFKSYRLEQSWLKLAKDNKEKSA
jgi:DNA-binding transcriptional ArsR family regulator